MSAVFITASGTEAGKTFAAAALVHQLKEEKRDALALKPVVTGYRDLDPKSDPAVLLRAMGLKVTRKNVAAIAPWRYREPLAPSQAAAKAGRPVERKVLLEFCRKGIEAHETTLIEGIGGAFVPLAGGFLVADWIAALKIPALLVTASYLGTLSHTLATLEALKARKIVPCAVIVTQTLTNPVPLPATVKSLEAEIGKIPVFPLPYQTGKDGWRSAPPMLHLLKKS